MPENPGEVSSGVRVMSPDEEDARAVARAIASSTAGGILSCFQGQEITASEIAATLHLPIPTIMYHLDALLEAGLIEVSRITYSVKGREVKKYKQSKQVFIVAPKEADIRETLLKYASLFGFTILSAGIVSVLLQKYHGRFASDAFDEIKDKGIMAAIANSPEEAGYGDIAREMGEMPLSAPQPVYHASLSLDPISPPASSLVSSVSSSTPPDIFGIPDLTAGILIGGFLVLLALICIDLFHTHQKDRS
jgi:DNA-binding transcriptional ArsR family regulator